MLRVVSTTKMDMEQERREAKEIPKRKITKSYFGAIRKRKTNQN